MKAMTMKNIIAGFRTSGVYPLNCSKLIELDIVTSGEPMLFNPMLSPCKKAHEVPVKF